MKPEAPIHISSERSNAQEIYTQLRNEHRGKCILGHPAIENLERWVIKGANKNDNKNVMIRQFVAVNWLGSNLLICSS